MLNYSYIINYLIKKMGNEVCGSTNPELSEVKFAKPEKNLLKNKTLSNINNNTQINNLETEKENVNKEDSDDLNNNIINNEELVYGRIDSIKLKKQKEPNVKNTFQKNYNLDLNIDKYNQDIDGPKDNIKQNIYNNKFSENITTTSNNVEIKLYNQKSNNLINNNINEINKNKEKISYTPLIVKKIDENDKFINYPISNQGIIINNELSKEYNNQYQHLKINQEKNNYNNENTSDNNNTEEFYKNIKDESNNSNNNINQKVFIKKKPIVSSLKNTFHKNDKKLNYNIKGNINNNDFIKNDIVQNNNITDDEKKIQKICSLPIKNNIINPNYNLIQNNNIKQNNNDYNNNNIIQNNYDKTNNYFENNKLGIKENKQYENISQNIYKKEITPKEYNKNQNLSDCRMLKYEQISTPVNHSMLMSQFDINEQEISSNNNIAHQSIKNYIKKNNFIKSGSMENQINLRASINEALFSENNDDIISSQSNAEFTIINKEQKNNSQNNNKNIIKNINNSSKINNINKCNEKNINYIFNKENINKYISNINNNINYNLINNKDINSHLIQNNLNNKKEIINYIQKDSNNNKNEKEPNNNFRNNYTKINKTKEINDENMNDNSSIISSKTKVNDIKNKNNYVIKKNNNKENIELSPVRINKPIIQYTHIEKRAPLKFTPTKVLPPITIYETTHVPIIEDSKIIQKVPILVNNKQNDLDIITKVKSYNIENISKLIKQNDNNINNNYINSILKNSSYINQYNDEYIEKTSNNSIINYNYLSEIKNLNMQNKPNNSKQQINSIKSNNKINQKYNLNKNYLNNEINYSTTNYHPRSLSQEDFTGKNKKLLELNEYNNSRTFYESPQSIPKYNKNTNYQPNQMINLQKINPLDIEVEPNSKEIINYYSNTNLKLLSTFSYDSYKFFYPQNEQYFQIRKEEIVSEKEITSFINNNPKLKEKYIGNVNQYGFMHGHGRLFTPTSKLIGTWQNGKFTGWGREIRNNGEVYEGKFENGKITGKGVYKYKDILYIGDFVKNIREGKGEKLTKNYYYNGYFNNDKINGFGRIQFINSKDGESEYEGDFKENNIEGKGIMKWKNGNRYEGEMKNNKMNGEGILKLNNGVILKGAFQDGNYVDKRNYINKSKLYIVNNVEF